MHWWRVKRRNGAWLALGALLLQLALSFGHIHAGDIAGVGAGLAVAAPSSAALADPPSDGSDDHGTTGSRRDDCAICAAVHLAGALLLSAPPSIALPGTLDRISWSPYTEFRLAADRLLLFQSRAPPTA
jgi:Protein of unknown function (DUF2946)